MADDAHQPLENPAASAGIFSRFVSQSWMNSMLKKSKKHPLNDTDIYKVLPRDSTEELTSRLQRYWDHEVKTSDKPSLRLPLMKLAGKRYFFSLVYVVIELVLRITQPIFIGKLVAVFQDGVEHNRTDGYTYATIIALCACGEVISHHPLFLELLRTGMNLRVATSALVYRKALKMSQSSLASTNTGQIVNLVTNDVQKIDEAAIFSLYLLVAPFLLAVMFYLYWVEIGYIFISGVVVMFTMIRFQAFLGKFFAAFREKTAILRDERIKTMNEVICGMRVIKMYTWEHPFAKLINTVRRKETDKVMRTTRLYSTNAALYGAAIPVLTMAMFVPYVLTGNTLTSDKVFTLIGLITTANLVTAMFVPNAITFLKEGSVSLRRIQAFLLMDEGLPLSLNKVDEDQSRITVKNIYSSWDKERDDNALSDISFEVSLGELLMVVGPVGCGKSSLLMALLRELPVTSGEIRISGKIAYVSQQPWVFSGTLRENILFGKEYNKENYEDVIRVCALEKDIQGLLHGDETLVGERGLSLSGGQKARVNLARAIYQNASIYLMDDPLSAVDAHVARHIFNECIRGILKSKVCILASHQLQFLNEADRILCLYEGNVVDYGHFNSLSEKGKEVLSVIQDEEKGEEDHESLKENSRKSDKHVFPRRRIERHVSYSPSHRRKHSSLYEIPLETDQLLEDRKQTLNLQYKARSAHDLGKHTFDTMDIAFKPQNRSINRLISYEKKPRTTSFMSVGSNDFEVPGREDIASVEDDEELATSRSYGQITWKVYKDYFLAGATPAVLVVCSLLILSSQGAQIVCEWWLARWSNWEESHLGKNDSKSIIEDDRPTNISIYVALVATCFVLAFISAVLFFQILISSSRHLHDSMFQAILRTPIYFFDTNPVGRILNRFSKDIGNMDDVIPMVFFDAVRLSVLAISIVLTSVVSLPYVLIAVFPIVVAFVWLRQYFVQTSRQIKRLEALSRSPLYSHISATLQGLATIRASEEQHQFRDTYDKFQDHNSSAWFLYMAANRWLGFRLDVLCATLLSVVAFGPLLAFEAGLEISPVLVGLSLLYAKRLTGMFQYCVRQTAEVENQMVSVERVQEYCHLEPEAELEIPDKKPSDDWPQHGAITGENLRFRYHSTLPDVLKDITFNIQAKEKIGIVGRTGAGKSSLISALFRLAEPHGVLKIDGLSITDIGLHDLRGRLSIIPQDPVIFAGSVRSNLDPFTSHTDIALWNALQQVQLKEVVDNLPGQLDFLLTESGSNFSVGQRQLICLARAILKHNKILIIDEATANVDHKTDQQIQETIRSNFKDCTVLTIAHRLNTIMDADRIMVLDSGRVVEFEEPYELLKRSGSVFFKMVAQTGQEGASQLQKMARLAHEKRSGQEQKTLLE